MTTEILNNSWNNQMGQAKEGLLGEAQKTRGLLAGVWSWGPEIFLDTLHARDMLMSEADKVPLPSKP